MHPNLVIKKKKFHKLDNVKCLNSNLNVMSINWSFFNPNLRILKNLHLKIY